ncbi:CAZyme family AA11 [Penicillium alfredii]|uniref:AA9 family lytic polysaccharide monooxygenase n=1 Tax=Penicillium alfredii TaxID=1506179 RepID=A0A9W9FRA9_9EURO|nr:CAZyme family AA11 [Penicillium alfredii]KAJ5104615.1 CAZyme family AA11 [Penicillium alfredii]
MMFTKSMLAAVLGASLVNAHMKMSHPVPYSADSLNNSPLAADGSDFPCKLRSNAFQAPTQENKMAIGESQKLTFEGSATHGGGSCQVSLTTDKEPTKKSEWKVIKSYEGGCPANVEGNMGGGETATDPTTFNFTIPSGIEAGKYTLAWTWFNRIGNREMYMNCAPITVTGGSSKRSEEEVEKRDTKFPPMFVANVNGCTTKEGVDIRFPQPGDDVDQAGNPSNLAPQGSEACTGTAKFGGSGATSSGSDSGSSASSAPADSAPSATSSASAAPAAATTQSPAAQSSAPTESQAVPSASQAPAPASSGSSEGTLSGSCSPEGTWNCIAGSSFQRCAGGQWSTSQQLASGTQCSPGQSAEMSISATKQARMISAMRFRKRTVIGE